MDKAAGLGTDDTDTTTPEERPSVTIQPSSDQVTKYLNAWKRSLLELSARNRLLNFSQSTALSWSFR